MRGITDHHHWRVRHHSTATTSTQTPMTYSVLPTLDMNSVTVLPVAVRPSWNHQLRSFSHSEYVSSGPLSR